jgi:hypothetical protein
MSGMNGVVCKQHNVGMHLSARWAAGQRLAEAWAVRTEYRARKGRRCCPRRYATLAQAMRIARRTTLENFRS